MRDREGCSPLELAIECGHKDIEHYLIGLHDDKDKARLLCQESEHGRLVVLRKLVEYYKCDPRGEMSVAHATHTHVNSNYGMYDVEEIYYNIDVMPCFYLTRTHVNCNYSVVVWNV